MTSSKALPAVAAANGRGRTYEVAFLPAALEIVETPPLPIGRAIAATIIAFFCAALAWACWGTVDIVATAPGKIVPTGRTNVIQRFEIGVVSAIRVQDGQSVKADDVLIELDPTMSNAKRDHLRDDLLAAQLDIARLLAAVANGPYPLADFHLPEGATPTQIATAREFLLSQTGEQRAKLAELEREQAQKEAERTTIAATIGKIEAVLLLLQQRLDIRKSLAERQLDSKLNYLGMLQQVVEQQQELGIQKSRLREADAALAAILETRAQTVA
jgi:hemolysin D